ncbi:LysR family transcriptional regulator [Aquimarina sp. Aq78]|uniref:LysR family transcriptional regulator n=1 Tax=Aquimarina sp. Aq78 TaxID=1191889 RepID=UPI000D10C3FC|nr:LysR family transcriptional regulator [Aquimarina sp. Aq78]
MELRQLNYFVKAAECLNFTEAAHKVFITQSALSQQIKLLEQELGVPLFDRIGKRIQLTEAGSLFLTRARHTLKNAENAKQLIEDLQNLQSGTLHIGVTYGLTNLFTETLISFSTKFPSIQVKAFFGTSDELMEKLKSGMLDFILSFNKATDDQMITTIPLFQSYLMLVVHESHRLANKKQISIEELNTMELAVPAEGFTTRKVLDKAFRTNEFPYHYQIELNHIPTLIRLIETGKWATVLTKSTTQYLPTLKSIPINKKKLKLRSAIRYLKGNYQKKASKIFFQMILEHYEQNTDLN